MRNSRNTGKKSPLMDAMALSIKEREKERRDQRGETPAGRETTVGGGGGSGL